MCMWGSDLKYSHGCSKTGFLTKYACFKGAQILVVIGYLIIFGIAISMDKKDVIGVR